MDKMIDLWTYLARTNKKILLYGTGNGADKILDELTKREISVDGVFASDGFVRNRVFRGFQVLSYTTACEKFGDFISLVCFGSSLAPVMDNIKKIASEGELYAPDVPVVDNDSIFDTEYVREHKEELFTAYNLLADDFSKKVFENVVLYKLTGKLDYLFQIETPKIDTYEMLGVNDSEVYADLGAYTGDTVKEFLEYANDYKGVIAAEPDVKNYKKLVLNTENLKNISCFNVCISKDNGKIPFAMNSGRNSLAGKGETLVDAINIDTLLQNTGVSFIKMDIEGQEKNALLGGQKILSEQMPKLNIAAYHRNEDLFEIPILLNKINPNYKIYMRHHPYIPAWDTNFYAL